MPREHGPAPSPTNATACHNPNPHNLHPGSTTLHPQQQMPAPTDLIAAPTRAEGTQHCTLSHKYPRQPHRGRTTLHPRQQIHSLAASLTTLPRAQGARPCTLSSKCARQPPPSPQHPSPKEHTPAPSATNARAGRLPRHATPRRRCTALHLRQQMRASTDLIAAPTRAKGTQHCTLSSRYPYPSPQSPRQPTPKEHCNAPSATDIHANHPKRHPIPHPGHTTPHPQQQMPTQTIPIAAPTPPRAHNPAPSTVIIALPYHPAEHAIACGRSTDASSLASRAASPCHRAVQCDRPRCAPSLLADFPHTSHSVSR